VRKTIEQRLLDRTTENEDGCWICNYSFDGDRYPLMNVYGKTMRCNRIAYELWVGSAGDKYVCHSCDEPRCINPGHFFLGTNSENMQDMIKKGRQNYPKGDRHGSKTHPEKLSRGKKHSEIMKRVAARGEEHGMAKLTEIQVREIRAYRDQRLGYGAIAKLINLPKGTVGNVFYDLVWKHVK
jgi:hypothetical protein